MRVCLVVFLFILCTISTACSQNCSDPQTQREMNVCAKLNFEKTDQILNTDYRTIVSKLGNKGIENLKTAQRAWIKYRDTHCDAVTNGYRGGSMEPLIQYECLKVMTEQRTESLRLFYPDQSLNNTSK